MLKPEIFISMKGYNAKTFSKDLLSGVLVAIVALPLSIAFGIQSGLTLQQGIITAIVSGFFISFLGGSRFQIGGPTVTFVALCFGYISNPAIGILGMQVAVFFGGIILLLMSVFKLGNAVKYIPASVVVGFTVANGLMLLVGQLKDFFGIVLPENTPQEVIPKIIALFQNINTISVATIIVGIVAVAIIYITPKINKKIPAVFLSLIVVTVITIVLGLIDESAFGVATIGSKYGDVKPTLDMPYFAGLKTLNYTLLIAPAFIIALLATMEGLLSATVADGMTGTKHNSNQELFGLGVANMASALMGGLPATGVLARTATNINSGGKTSMVGIIHSVVLLLMYLLLMPLVKFIPLTALAAILITVSAKLINVKRFVKVVRFNVKDSIVMALTFVICVTTTLIVGVVTGIVLTVVFTLYRLIKHKVTLKIDVEKVFDLVPVKEMILATDTNEEYSFAGDCITENMIIEDKVSEVIEDVEKLEKVLQKEIITEIVEEIVASEDVQNDEEILLDEILLRENNICDKIEKRTIMKKIREAERIKIKGNINFINIVSLTNKIEKELLHHSVVIVDMDEVSGVDLTAVEKIEGLVSTASRNKKRVILCKRNDTIMRKFNLLK